MGGDYTGPLIPESEGITGGHLGSWPETCSEGPHEISAWIFDVYCGKELDSKQLVLELLRR